MNDRYRSEQYNIVVQAWRVGTSPCPDWIADLIIYGKIEPCADQSKDLLVFVGVCVTRAHEGDWITYKSDTGALSMVRQYDFPHFFSKVDDDDDKPFVNCLRVFLTGDSTDILASDVFSVIRAGANEIDQLNVKLYRSEQDRKAMRDTLNALRNSLKKLGEFGRE